MPPVPVRVLLVDDSPLALAVLKKMLADSSEVEVVGVARHGREALELIPQLKPHVICLDFHMPLMDGLELTRQIMGRFPLPILVVSSTVHPDNQEKVFPLLQAGALDIFPKPSNVMGDEKIISQRLISKIKLLSGVPVFTRPLRSEDAPGSSADLTLSRPGVVRAAIAPATPAVERARKQRPIGIVAIGASTGGPQTVQAILSKLPANFPVPILCVQHISEGFLQGLIDWLGSQCQLKIQIARSGETPNPGTVYFPVEGTHLELAAKDRLTASRKPPVGGHRPSVTTTFKSIADHYGESGLAVLLTGMGRDGADGMQAVAQAGGITIAQDEATSVVFGMPKQAIELGAARHILPTDEIAQMLLDYVSGTR